MKINLSISLSFCFSFSFVKKISENNSKYSNTIKDLQCNFLETWIIIKKYYRNLIKIYFYKEGRKFLKKIFKYLIILLVCIASFLFFALILNLGFVNSIIHNDFKIEEVIKIIRYPN